jgi:uncharacterized protein YndB with AHSA1/START domain
MPQLFVDKTVEIEAPASKVWAALTRRDATAKWAPEFSDGGPAFHLESDWNLGSAVSWKDKEGNVFVEGNVTAREPNRFLRFTVFDVRSPRALTGPEDGISYELSEGNGKTTLHIRQGDFSVIPDGEKFRRMTDETWDRVLPKVKQLAEA